MLLYIVTDQNAFTGDFKVICRKYIPDNSINLIFTDPSYDTQHLYLYEALGTECFRVLKECGSLLTYAPHYALPQIFDFMKKSGLSYWWMFTVERGSRTIRMQEQKLWVGWKPVLWFVKGKKVNSVNDIFDIVRSQSIDKELNIWEQPTIESDYFIQHLTEENETVLDPMMGSGTTGISALKLRRKFIGIATSESNFLESQNRLRQAAPYKHPELCGMTEACLVDRLVWQQVKECHRYQELEEK
ncbi:MAG: site-specific DNA-methyltransferase [Candidatus Nitrosopolaris sp.]